MRDPKKRIISQALVWLRKCRKAGVINEVLADIHNADILADIRKRPPTLNNDDNLEEARDFAKSLESYVGGLCYLGDHFQAAMLKKASEVINNLIADITDSKENEGEKETFPPAPPIKKKGKQEKATATTTRGGARVRAVDNFTPPTREEVAEFANTKKIPALFVSYWFDCMENNYYPPWYDSIAQKFITHWRRSLLVYWNRSNRDHVWREYAESHTKAEAEKPKNYPAEDWILCAERCRHFDERICRCRCGCAVPPNKREYPQTPEQCERYHKKTNEKKEGAK